MMLGGLFVGGRRYESRAGIEPGRQRDGGPMG
jgi:hypothetical protein